MCGSYHLGRQLNVKIGVEYRIIFVVLFFNVPVKFILRHFQDFEKVLGFHYKTCTVFKIQCHFQHLITRLNNIIHTFISMAWLLLNSGTFLNRKKNLCTGKFENYDKIKLSAS